MKYLVNSIFIPFILLLVCAMSGVAVAESEDARLTLSGNDVLPRNDFFGANVSIDGDIAAVTGLRFVIPGVFTPSFFEATFSAIHFYNLRDGVWVETSVIAHGCLLIAQGCLPFCSRL